MSNEDEDRWSFRKALWLSHPKPVRVFLSVAGFPVWAAWMIIIISGHTGSNIAEYLFWMMLALLGLSFLFVVKAFWNNEI